MDFTRASRPVSWLLFVGMSLMTTGCGDNGNFSAAVERALADYVFIDLDTGEISYRAQESGLPAPALIRDNYLVLRRMPPCTFTHGLPVGAGLVGDSDEQPVVTPVRTIFVGIFELTTAQWQRLNQTPVTGDSQPQTGIALADIRARLQQFSARTRLTVRLPTDSEWEAAARMNPDRNDGGVHLATTLSALVRESALQSSVAINGPQTVGSRTATGLGLYDIIGNVWEWTATTGVNGVDIDGFAHVRGGSWSDPFATARVTNIVKLDPECSHPDIGFRVVMVP